MNARQPTTLARVREVFGSAGFRRLVYTRAVSQAGDGIFQLATAKLLLFDNPHQNIALTFTLLSVVTLIPFSAVAPFAGVLIDRWDRRRILEVTPALRAGLALLITAGVGAHRHGADFYFVVLFVLSANRLFLATMSAVLPQFVPVEDLLVANAVASTGGSIAQVLGLGVGAALSQVMGGTRAAGIASVAFALTAALASRLSVRRGIERGAPQPLGAALRGEVSDMIAGFRAVKDSPRVRYAMSAVTVAQGFVGALVATVAVYFITYLHLKVGSSTTLLGVIALGIGIGVVLVPSLARRVLRRDALIPISFAVGGAAVVGTGIGLSRAAVVFGGVFVGIAYAMVKIPVDTIVQEEMDDSIRGRAFSVYDMLFNTARVIGTAIAAAAASAGARPQTIVVAAGFGYLVASLILALVERRLADVRPLRLRTRARAPAARPGFDLPVGEMVTVRSYSGHRDATEPRAIVVGGREVPVDEVVWRAVEERSGVRRRIFVVRVGGLRVRLATDEESSRWEVERILASNDLKEGGGP